MKIKVYSFPSRFMGPLILSLSLQEWESLRTPGAFLSLFSWLRFIFSSKAGGRSRNEKEAGERRDALLPSLLAPRGCLRSALRTGALASLLLGEPWEPTRHGPCPRKSSLVCFNVWRVDWGRSPESHWVSVGRDSEWGGGWSVTGATPRNPQKRGVFVRILRCKVTNCSLFSILYSLERSYCTGHTRNEESCPISMKAEHLHRLFGIILYRGFYLFPYLVLQPCVFVVWTHGHLYVGDGAIQLSFVA